VPPRADDDAVRHDWRGCPQSSAECAYRPCGIGSLPCRIRFMRVVREIPNRSAAAVVVSSSGMEPIVIVPPLRTVSSVCTTIPIRASGIGHRASGIGNVVPSSSENCRRTRDSAGGRRTSSSSARTQASCSVVVMMVSLAAGVDAGAMSSSQCVRSPRQGVSVIGATGGIGRAAASESDDPAAHRRGRHHQPTACSSSRQQGWCRDQPPPG